MASGCSWSSSSSSSSCSPSLCMSSSSESIPLHHWSRLSACDAFVGSRRSKHTMVCYSNNLYVFGGDNGHTMLNDLLVFSTREKSWARAPTSGSPPAPRYHHSAVVSGDSMFVFGGYTGDIHSNSNLTNRNDLFEYKFNVCQWHEWRIHGRKPVPRAAHGSVIHDNHLYVFYGYDGTTRLRDMWKLSLATNEPHVWEEVSYLGEAPPTCCNFAVAIADNHMYVFSGQSGNIVSNSVFQFNFKTRVWTSIKSNSILHAKLGPKVVPTRRYGHTMVAYHRHLYVFGGAAENMVSDDVHCFDLDAQTWRLIRPSSESEAPSSRLFHAAAVLNDAMFVFGGTYENNKRSCEMHRFQLGFFPRCTLQDDLGKLLRRGKFADVHFIVGIDDDDNKPDVVAAHSAIVAARSVYLRDQIRAEWRRREEKLKQILKEPMELKPSIVEVRLHRAQPLAFRLLLHFVYTDIIDPSMALGMESSSGSSEVMLIMMHVLSMASDFQMTRLVALAESYLEHAIDLDNVLLTLANASQLGLSSIRSLCLKFIAKESNFSHVIASSAFEALDKTLVVDIIRRKHNSSSNNNSNSKNNSEKMSSTEQPPSYTDAMLSNCNSNLWLEGCLEEDLKRFLYSDIGADFTDITLLLDSEPIGAHRAILAARSEYFEGLFRSFSPKNNSVMISIGDTVPSRQSFMSLLNYIYYGETTMPAEDALYLFSAPHYFMFTNNRLQVFCKRNLERNVTVENVLQVLEAADNSHAADMKHYALTIIVRHFARVVKLPRLRVLSRELLLDILYAVGDHTNSENNTRIFNDFNLPLNNTSTQ